MLFRIFLALFVFLSCVTTPAFAASDDSSLEAERDEYDFSWLDPDKKIYVVQNRKYLKANRLELSASGNIGIGQKYRTVRGGLFRGTFYFSENWGVSGFYGMNQNVENDTFVQLKNIGAFPAVRELQHYYGGSLMWLPFYGKINLFNQIFYVDWHFEGGVSSVQSQIDLNTRVDHEPDLAVDTYMAVHWGSGWKFFITRYWAARMDFLAVYYKAPTGLRGSLVNSEDETYDNYSFNLGLSYTF